MIAHTETNNSFFPDGKWIYSRTRTQILGLRLLSTVNDCDIFP